MRFKWIESKLLTTDVYHPWYSIEYDIKGLDFLPIYMDGHLVQGDHKKSYYIDNMRKRIFQDGDTMEGLGFRW